MKRTQKMSNMQPNTSEEKIKKINTFKVEILFYEDHKVCKAEYKRREENL